MGRPKNRVLKFCLQCKKEFETFHSEIKKGGGKFCSRSCATTYRNLHFNPSWDEDVRKKISKNHADVSGIKNPMYGRRGRLAPGYVDGRHSFSGEHYRKVLLASGTLPKCKLCGACAGRIEVHHIDGDRDNNDLSNLVFLCQKCHLTKAHSNIVDEQNKIIGKTINKLNF